jgi:hypothetical protein
VFNKGLQGEPLISKQKDVRYLDIHEDDEFDEAEFADWVTQAASMHGWKP